MVWWLWLCACLDPEFARGLDHTPILAGERCADDREEEVACVLDGDTIVLGNCETGENVRMLGVDADEIAHNDSEVAECWGDEAAAWTTDKLLGETVRLEFDKECEDKYQRTLAYVWLPEANDGEDELVNLSIILQGQAYFYEEFGDIRWHAAMESAQSNAQTGGQGFWSECL